MLLFRKLQVMKSPDELTIVLSILNCQNSMNRTDEQEAIEILSRSMPEAARLSQNALRFLARNALKHACRMVPGALEEEDEEQKDAALADFEEQNMDTPKERQAARLPTNSNDILPSVRPFNLSNPPSTVRKRRRVSRVGSGNTDGIAKNSLRSYIVPRPNERLSDVGGIESTLQTIRELVEWPLIHKDLYQHLGVDPPRGILLHGPPGCGKTLLAHAVAGELGTTFIRVSGPEIVSGMSGESERKLRDMFTEATQNQPSIIFVDEIDAIASKREGASKEMERRIVSQLLSCIDNLSDNNLKRHRKEPSEETNASDGLQGTSEHQSHENQDSDSADLRIGGSESKKTNQTSSVIVIASTNRPESLEPALRRAGRFDREIELGAPDESGRASILEKLTHPLKLGDDVELKALAKSTAGYVGADLHLLVKEAGLACVRRFAYSSGFARSNAVEDVDMNDVDKDPCDAPVSSNHFDLTATAPEQPENDKPVTAQEESGTELDAVNNDQMADQSPTTKMQSFTISDVSQKYSSCYVQMEDFQLALKKIQPSALREGFATRPDISWKDVGSLEFVREEMMMAIVEPIRNPEMFSSLGLNAPAGVLLYGPPGCGKTLLARAVAAESGANFISVKGPELLSKYVGDSELAVRKVFSRARCSSPCVIFFDELDALAPRRGGGKGATDSSGAAERVVNMLLTEMDGFSERKQVFLIAATNRPDIIDPAMLRPGRLDKLIYVPLPDANGRSSILKTLSRKVAIHASVDITYLANHGKCEGFSGADLQALIRTAGEQVLWENRSKAVSERISKLCIEVKHFEKAFDLVCPSVSTSDAKLYRNMENLLRKQRSRISKEQEET